MQILRRTQLIYDKFRGIKTMSHCTTTELANLTGSGLATAVLQEIIDQADREIGGRLALMGVGVPMFDDTLKSASLNLAKIGVLTHPDSDQVASSVRLGDITIKRADLETVLSDLAEQAWKSVDDYIKMHAQHEISRFYIRKVN